MSRLRCSFLTVAPHDLYLWTKSEYGPPGCLHGRGAEYRRSKARRTRADAAQFVRCSLVFERTLARPPRSRSSLSSGCARRWGGRPKEKGTAFTAEDAESAERRNGSTKNDRGQVTEGRRRKRRGLPVVEYSPPTARAAGGGVFTRRWLVATDEFRTQRSEFRTQSNARCTFLFGERTPRRPSSEL